MSRKTSPVAGGDTATISQYNNLRDEANLSSFLLPRQQASPDLTLYVSEGACYFSGVRVDFAGGNSPSFTAPVSNPRIDVLSINSSGTLVRTAGVEAGSPTAPAVPVGEIPICLVYNRVGQTSVKEASDGSNGYIYKDIRRALSNENPLVPVIKVYRMSFGLSTTRYDITNPTGTTFRYTYDGTGANPIITSTSVPIGTILVIAGQNFNAANNGTFTVTGSGSNYFEVTNASGVAENDKTLGTGTIKVRYTKPTNLLYAVIECVGGGGMGGNGSGIDGGQTLFGSVITCNGGKAGGTSSRGGAGGTATGGDINITGMKGQDINIDSNSSTVIVLGSRGGASALGAIGRGGDWDGNAANNSGAAGGGGGYAKKIIASADLGSTEDMLIGCGGGPAITYSEVGANGAIIITEYLSV